MVMSESATTTVAVTVNRPMNHHGTMTVEVAGTNEVRHLVEFAPEVRSVLADLPSETTLPLEMRQLPARGSCWRVTGVGSRSGSR
jgi:hypothetical protein